MEGIAFVVGVSRYTDAALGNLNCPEKDAADFAQVLRDLKYEVIDSYGEPKDKVDDKWNDFKERIQSEEYPTAIIYFSGHGMHVNNSECLLLTDAVSPKSVTDSRAKGKSLILNDLMAELDDLEIPVKIFIVDACRTIPSLKGVPYVHNGIRMSEISRQTFVAYATAVGKPARDGGEGENSVFTEALLDYIKIENLPIEQLFKKVRLHLIEKAIDQIPWEHTCLITDFAFNHGQLSKYHTAPYSETAFKYADYRPTDKLQSEIFEGLKSERTADIARSLKLIDTNFRSFTPEFKFVIGRLISRQASEGDRRCMSLIDNVSKIKVIDGSGNDLLKGIFYDLYFDSEDRLRNTITGNVDFLNAVEKLRELIGDRKAEDFVSGFLSEDGPQILYRIGQSFSVPVKIQLEDTGIEFEGLRIMRVNAVDLPDTGESLDIAIHDLIFDRNALRHHLARILHLPEAILKLNVNDRDVYTTFYFDGLESYFNAHLQEYINDEIDSLSSNSYILSVLNTHPHHLFKDFDGYNLIGDCTLTVHMEFDHEELPPMVFPSGFDVSFLPDVDGYRLDTFGFEPDTSSYYE